MESLESSVKLEGAAQSLLLTLASRAFESAQQKPIVQDQVAKDLLKRIRYDAAQLSQDRLYHTIICLRTRRFDAAVSSFLRTCPTGTIVNLGCGLDTRFERLDNGRARWLDLDFPEVIELRRKLLEENSRRRFVACSITDLRWLDEVSVFASTPVLFLAEGVLMFVEPNDVHGMMSAICSRFPGSSLLFDAVTPLEVSLQRYHPTLRKTQARLRWGLPSPQSLRAAHPNLRLVAQWFYCDEPEPRLGWYRRLRFLPWVTRTARVLLFDVIDLQAAITPSSPSR
ncbi:MAG: class I SAM-dependent methyltransferase [Myxococcota bacterium]